MTTTRVASARPATTSDRDGIASTIADYYLGWFDGDPDRMARALHPELAKRGWIRGASGAIELDRDTAGSMVELTRQASGRGTAPADRHYEIRAVECHRDIASACVYAVPYVDYLHLVRTAEGWRIINALWCEP